MYQSPGHKVVTVMVGYICHRFKLGRCWYIWNKPDVRGMRGSSPPPNLISKMKKL